MSGFPDSGRQVLGAVIAASLGTRAVEYDIRALVNAYVEEFGFVDIDEVDREAYENLVASHIKD